MHASILQIDLFQRQEVVGVKMYPDGLMKWRNYVETH